MLINLTHPEENFELWVDFEDIVTLNSDKPDVTAIVLKSGKTIACKETPAQIFEKVENSKNFGKFF